MERNRNAANEWPANVLYARIRRMLADDHLDEDESVELLELLREITGGVMPEGEGSGSGSTTIERAVGTRKRRTTNHVKFENARFAFRMRFNAVT